MRLIKTGTQVRAGHSQNFERIKKKKKLTCQRAVTIERQDWEAESDYCLHFLLFFSHLFKEGEHGGEGFFKRLGKSIMKEVCSNKDGKDKAEEQDEAEAKKKRAASG